MALVGVGVVGGPTFVRIAAAAGSPRVGSLFVTPSQLAQVRRNVFDLELDFAARAWANVARAANGLLGHEATPPRPDSDVSDWHRAIYRPGLADGNAALTLAIAYAVSGRTTYARQAKTICLAWARTYNPAPPIHTIGHYVAEPVGPVIKLCMAFDLTKSAFSATERAGFRAWAAQFVQRGRINADVARDRPWVADVTYGDDPRTNPAPYGNGANWQRAMAVWSAAAVGESTLREALEWNFRHTTSGGKDYGWDNVLEGLVIDGSGGQVIEDRYRSSILYGHFSWIPLVLIADVARNARFGVDLYKYKTKGSGHTIFTPVAYYSRFASKSSVADSLERTDYGGAAWPATASRLRAWYEILYRNATDRGDVKRLHRAVNHGGARQRGDNYDVYVHGHAALFGRGPKGPGPTSSARS